MGRSLRNLYDEMHSLDIDINKVDAICVEKYATIDKLNELEKKVNQLSSNKNKRRIKSVTVRI